MSSMRSIYPENLQKCAPCPLKAVSGIKRWRINNWATFFSYLEPKGLKLGHFHERKKKESFKNIRANSIPDDFWIMPEHCAQIEQLLQTRDFYKKTYALQSHINCPQPGSQYTAFLFCRWCTICINILWDSASNAKACAGATLILDLWAGQRIPNFYRLPRICSRTIRSKDVCGMTICQDEEKIVKKVSLLPTETSFHT